MMMTLDATGPTVHLKPREERRLLAGHPWIFSNEIREIRGEPGSGDVVEIRSSAGKFMGIGFYHGHSLIAVRLLSRDPVAIDQRFYEKRLTQAHRLRQMLFPGAESYRLAHGEADFLPGLVIDRLGNTLVVQTLSAGMDARLPLICDALEALFAPLCIVERNESPLRSLESLPERVGVLRGSVAPVEFQEHGIRYRVNPLEGQKTGFFLDQRENRLMIRRYASGARVLDCFCNTGGFALNAARGGAPTVLALDSSPDALGRARTNAQLNGIDNVTFEETDVFTRLESLRAASEVFDLVILDPPSFTRSRKSVPAAKRGYRELHQGAFRVLRRGGVLVSASCSHHIEPEVFGEVIADAALRSGRTLQLLEWHGAAADHPVIPGVPETAYLKLGVYRVL